MPKIPKHKLSPKLKSESLKKLLSEIRRVVSQEDMNKFLDIFFTEGGKDVILRRIAAMILLSRGKKYRDIKEDLQMSGNTLSRASGIILGASYGRTLKKKEHLPTNSITSAKKRKKTALWYKGVRVSI